MNEQKIPLNGEWELNFTHPQTGKKHTIPAAVPGNVEIDLQRAGLIKDYWPVDDYFAMYNWENVDDWVWRTSFDAPDVPEGHTAELVFEGIDTIADVLLNGQKILRCENMLVPHTADVNGLLEARNILEIRIYSPNLYARKYPYNAFAVHQEYSQPRSYLRKAAHMWGWDNAPRLVSAGIWRPVYLKIQPPVAFTEVYTYTQSVSKDTVFIGANWAFKTPDTDLSNYKGKMLLSFNGKTEFSFDFDVKFTYGVFTRALDRDSLKLWWPRGFGSPDLYDTTLQILKDGAPVAEWKGRFGIRVIELIHTDYIDENGKGEFVFKCNGEKIYINGTNWKPLDALQSRAEAKVRKALDLALDLNCNMIRVWGGGVYESEDFFDYCDENGLLIWQDFMFACAFPPRDDFFLEAVALEAKAVVKRIRNHPSLALWCGDNEVDCTFTWGKMMPPTMLPSHNEVSRKVLKNAVLSYDPYRSYIESSPYHSDEVVKQLQRNGSASLQTPEAHFYPPSYKFRESLYACRSRFIGETGPIIMNAVSENPEIIGLELPRAKRLWDTLIDEKDYTLALHQKDIFFQAWKSASQRLLRDFFNIEFTFEQFRDFTRGINMLCSDIFKFCIEYCRTHKWEKTGVIWWSLLDMWPQGFNYSVVDYSFTKKMPYYWIKQSQQPFCLSIVKDAMDAQPVLYAMNDTLQGRCGTYKIIAYRADDAAKEIVRGVFDVGQNCSTALQILPVDCSQSLLLIEWQTEEGSFCNHYISGKPPFSFEAWKKWCACLDGLYIKS
jgi:beta-mannosidase